MLYRQIILSILECSTDPFLHLFLFIHQQKSYSWLSMSSVMVNWSSTSASSTNALSGVLFSDRTIITSLFKQLVDHMLYRSCRLIEVMIPSTWSTYCQGEVPYIICVALLGERWGDCLSYVRYVLLVCDYVSLWH